MWSTANIILLLFVAVALSEVVPPYKIPGTNSLFLGIVDGKGYFADDPSPLDWKAAKAHCAGLGMRLASIETAEEKNFLAAIDHPQFPGLYWTAGRDARSTQQFVWDHNAKSVSENFDSLNYFYPERSCILFVVRTDAKGYESARCEAAVSGNNLPFGALCESI